MEVVYFIHSDSMVGIFIHIIQFMNKGFICVIHLGPFNLSFHKYSCVWYS
jgi:hypothetical protein